MRQSCADRLTFTGHLIPTATPLVAQGDFGMRKERFVSEEGLLFPLQIETLPEILGLILSK